MTAKNSRTYEVVVFGATGFTGRLVAEYLLQTYGVGGELRWAVAGRDQGKLEALRAELGPSAAQLPLLLADALNAASMVELASSTRVVCTTVGPYAKYGEQLVRACAKTGTDYCDLCGEPHWMRQMIDQHHDQAMQTGARIIHSCGFDSIPSDLGVHFLNRHALERFGEPCSQVKLRVERSVGAASGGTVATLLGVMSAARKDPEVARILRNPYALNPTAEMSGPDAPDLTSSAYDADLHAWIAPFIMAGINTRVVRRSHALLGYPYGKEFRYDEATRIGPGAGGRLKSTLLSLGLGAFGAAAFMAPGLLARLLPKPGEGPSAEQRERGSFSLLLLGKLADGRQLAARVTGDRDPGYGSSSKMLAESAVCLVKDVDERTPGGVLTPACCMAEPLLARLTNKAGLTFEIVSK